MDLAYLDPTSGSMLAAAVVAGFAGAMVAMKMWWRRLVGKIRRQPAGVEQQSAESAAGAASADESVSAEQSAGVAGPIERRE